MDLDSLGRQCKWNIYGIGRNQCSHANFLWLPSLGLMRICTHAGEGSADMVHGEQRMAARRWLWSVFASHGCTDALSFALLEKCFSLLSPDCAAAGGWTCCWYKLVGMVLSIQWKEWVASQPHEQQPIDRWCGVIYLLSLDVMLAQGFIFHFEVLRLVLFYFTFSNRGCAVRPLWCLISVLF